MISKKNMGVNGGWNLLLQAAPGEYVALLNDDIFFHEKWLDKCIEIIEGYPNVGYVSPFPIRTHYKSELNSSTLEFANKPEITLHNGMWDKNWDKIIFESVGYDKKMIKSLDPANDLPLLDYNGIKAFPFSSHFCILLHQELISKVLPLPWSDRAMGGSDNDPNSLINNFDKVVNELGFLKLSTFGVYAEHIGNRIDSRIKFLIEKYNIETNQLEKNTQKINDHISFFEKIIIYIFKIPILKSFPNYIIKKMDEILLKKAIYNKQRG